jgi:hypothetical protein
MYQGSQHSADFLLTPDPPFRTYDPDSPQSEQFAGAGRWVPQETLREYWAPSFFVLTDLLERLRGLARVLVLGTPPPNSEAYVRRVLQDEPEGSHFKRLAQQLGVDLSVCGISPDYVRLGMWRILQDMLHERAQTGGAIFVPVPAAAIGSDGLLLPEYRKDDATHANTGFGALMWAEVARHLV